jgi:hypothetical protein
MKKAALSFVSPIAFASFACLTSPVAHAALIAYDGFDSYANGALATQVGGIYNAANLNAVQSGKASQTGWNAGWKQIGTTTSLVVAAGLSATPGDKAVFDNAGGSMQAIRQWYDPTTDFTDGTVIWASVQVKNTSGGDTIFGLFQQSAQSSNFGIATKFTTTNNMQVGVRLSGTSAYAANGTSVSGTGLTVSTVASPALVYLKYTLSTTNNGDRLDVYVNPTVDPGGNAGDITINSGFYNFHVPSGSQQGTGHMVMGGFSSGQVGYDEVRIGTSFADVSPIPEPSAAVLGLLGVMGLVRRRR